MSNQFVFRTCPNFQVNNVLDTMPSAFLKSYDEGEAAKQEEDYKKAKAIYRTTMLFSATMPPGVERLARYAARE